MMMSSKTTDMTVDYDSVLKPAYKAAVEMTIAKLDAAMSSMPDVKEKYLPMLTHFVQEYLVCSQTALEAGGEEKTCSPAAAAGRILQVIDYGMKFGMGPGKYMFDVSHVALRGDNNPDSLVSDHDTDFYKFGCDFFRPCMDLKKSAVMGLSNLEKVTKQLEAGENVVFFANHQSEADPQVVSCLMEQAGYGDLAADMVYVAGHKVTTDALAVAFSMGRNLICIHSKKHINADPETKGAKSRQNMKAMSALLDGFKKGGSIVWVAPSGGRDRRNIETGDVPIADFDAKTIDMFRLMGNKSRVKTHFYTLAMVSYDLCPPPDFTVAGVGEDRNVRFVPVGIALGEECESVGGLECRKAFNQHAQQQCDEDYQKLLAALEQ